MQNACLSKLHEVLLRKEPQLLDNYLQEVLPFQVSDCYIMSRRSCASVHLGVCS